ncbi:PREDICTED: putative vacuolar protein sorting-associated protein 13F [Ipomoea nil]|uniref:putative vacuolar protein sorting-associated protein 13F n=1 Tax=Ipomoea nil TaxID=35883 RepID=UPI000900916B|nr:PREDICTED: putative vacuolar protein sorting-associated protein 13F [Ipomoea nil]
MEKSWRRRDGKVAILAKQLCKGFLKWRNLGEEEMGRLRYWQSSFTKGLVWLLLLGYLGQYIRDIQTEQLKITLWNEEVLLENVKLILEAFDYLQFPFALKQGHVCKLSIRIPWKKLGWDLVIIILEDVLICASQGDEKEAVTVFAMKFSSLTIMKQHFPR